MIQKRESSCLRKLRKALHLASANETESTDQGRQWHSQLAVVSCQPLGQHWTSIRPD